MRKSTGIEGQSLQLCCRHVSIFYLLCKILLYHRVSNHSLRVTGATGMWEANVPEKLIEEKTGHRSLEALRSSEHPLHMRRAVSGIIDSTIYGGILASSEDADCQSEVSNTFIFTSTSSYFEHPATIGEELFGKAFIRVINCTISVNVNYNKLYLWVLKINDFFASYPCQTCFQDT